MAGACRWASCWRRRSATPREGYVVTRSQARLTTEKLAELKDVPGFAPTFLIDGKPPDAGKVLKQAALAATLDQLAHAGLDDFYRGDVGREVAADLERLGSPVTRADLERCRATLAEPLSVEARHRRAVQHAAADPGPRLADDPRLVRAPARRRGRRLRSRPRARRGDQAGVPGARPGDHRSRADRRIRRNAISTRNSSMPRRARSIAARRRRGRRRRARATPSGWAPPTPPGSSSPTSSRSIGSSARAWCCRAPAC